MPFGGFQKAIATGAWVNQRLMAGEDYIENMWRAYSKEIRSVELQRPRKGRRFYKAPSYLSFAKYISALHRLGLLEMTREEQVPPPYGKAIPRHYFRIAPGMAADAAWDNPMRWAFVAERVPPKIVLPTVKPLTLGKSPTKVEVGKVLRHLESLRGRERETGVPQELERLSVVMADWVFSLEGKIGRLTGAGLEEVEELRDRLDEASGALAEHNLEKAIWEAERAIL